MIDAQTCKTNPKTENLAEDVYKEESMNFCNSVII